MAILAVIFLFSYVGMRPPWPKRADAPTTQFSAGRAMGVLARIWGGDEPHPVGSPADDILRARIFDELTHLGYQPQVQNAFDCSGFGTCATVNNILARLDGSDPADEGAVLVVAHYDSVPAGPGASDDGASVAAMLEIARVLKVLAPPRHPILLLIDEGEEAGLIGAGAFVDWHPWSPEVRAVVNLDARGSSGPSLLFETGSANQWTIQLYKRAAARPVTSSVFYNVYKQLPNDTDLTVFKSAGKQGANFAYLGEEPEYHTPLDNLSNVNSASLQHQGDNALAMTLAYANADLTNPPEKEAVYFDLFGRYVVEWAQSRAMPAALLSALFLVVQVALLFWQRRMTPREFLYGLAAFVMLLLTTGALGLILQSILRAVGAIPVGWIAHPLAVRLSFWLLALSVVVVHGIVFARRARFWGLWAGAWTWWALLGIVISWIQPGMSYLIQVPMAAAAIAGLVIAVRQSESDTLQWVAGLVPLAATALVGFAPLISLYSAVGTTVLPVLSVLVALVLSPLVPLCSDLNEAEGLLALSVPGVPIIAALLAAFAAAVIPPYSARAPERVNLQFWQDADSGKAQWVVAPESGRVPEPLALTTNFRSARSGEMPWGRGPAFLSDAPAANLGAPTFTVLDSSMLGEKREFRALLRSERGAPAAIVMFAPDSGIEDVRMENVQLQPETSPEREILNGWYLYGCVDMPAKGVEMTFDLPAGKPVVVTVVDRSYGLPDEGAFLTKARPLTAVPSGQGDVTILTRKVQLNP